MSVKMKLRRDCDTEQLVSRGHRSNYIKHYFIVIGVLCIVVVCLLFLLLDFGMVNNLTIIGNNVQIKKPAQLVRETKTEFSVVLRRQRRQLDEVKIRQKKRVNEQLDKLLQIFEKCRQTGFQASNCQRYRDEMISFGKLLHEKTQLMKKYHKLDDIDDSALDAHKFRPMPKVHEDLDAMRPNEWKMEKEKSMFDAMQHRADNLMPFAVQPDPSAVAQAREKSDDKILTPLKSQSSDVSNQLLSLCEQMGRQNTHADQGAQINNPGPTSSGFVTNNMQSHGFAPNNFQQPQQQPQQQQQQQQQQQFQPIGGTFAPIAPNPQMYRSNPVCFYNSPNMQQVPYMQNMFVPQPQFATPFTSNANPTGRFVFVPGGGQQQFGMSASSGQGFMPVMNQPTFLQARAQAPQAPPQLFCAYSPTQNTQMALSSSYMPDGKSVPTDTDVIYASGVSPQPFNHTNLFNICDDGEISCIGTNGCISTDKWCDNVVDCLDSSDETACTCESRLNPAKICDGYLDCPIGSDEIGCFGCDKFSYSCYDSVDEFKRHKKSSVSMCYSLMEKCDGVQNCLNGKDESDCSMLVKDIGLHKSFHVPYTEGFLYRNFRGHWYPVCHEPLQWATEACESELGPLDEEPEITYITGILPGPFASMPTPNKAVTGEEVHLSPLCEPFQHHQSQIVRARCPPMKCGIRQHMHGDQRFARILRIRTDDSDEADTARQKRDEMLRIVGGDRSLPHEWPFVVAIYENGRFICGGTIHMADWVITAAHCVEGAQSRYYEVRAGMLRRSSHAPEVQIVKVTHVIQNKNFQNIKLSDDVALFKLERPLNFNRWVKPICLPSVGRVKATTMSDWRNGPDAGTVCTAVGWGATRERGQTSDYLKEVDVPILESCTDVEDIDGNEICAGEKEGGRDACQGDSGGPLFCKSQNNPGEYYLAGIVSHGEGCARRNNPGVYTRVALYNEWITSMVESDLSETATPTQQTCPGFICVWSGNCISLRKRCDGVVDCLGGEDELQCVRNPGDDTLLLARNRSKSEFEEEPDLLETSSDLLPTKVGDSPSVSSTTGANDRLTTSKIAEQLPIGHRPTTETSKAIADAIEASVSTAAPATSTEKEQLTEHNSHGASNSDTAPETLEVKASSTTAKPTENTTEDRGAAPETTTQVATPSTVPPVVSTVAPETTVSDAPLKNQSLPAIHLTTLRPLVDIPQPSTEALHEPTMTTSGPLPSSVDSDSALNPPVDHINNRGNATLHFTPTHAEFKCTSMNQTVSASLRCDGMRDCEDGTDEIRCKCRDKLKVKSPHLICDGTAQCLDLSDEEDCLQCSPDEFKCGISKQCIPKRSRCDKTNDCTRAEDELDCVALTDGRTVLLDGDLKPSLRYKGIACENINGEWSVMCFRRSDVRVDGDQLAGQICSTIGFTGYTYHNASMVTENGEIKQRRPVTVPRLELGFLHDESSMRSRRSAIYSTAEEEVVAASKDKHCLGLYVECAPHSTIPIEHPPAFEPTTTPSPVENATVETSTRTPSKGPHVVPTTEKAFDIGVFNKTAVDGLDFDNFTAPWVASVLVNGDPACIGILVDKYWVIADIKCVNGTKWRKDVTYVILGQSGYPMDVTSPFTQVVRVDCMHTPVNRNNNTNVMLLHLSRPIIYSRAVLPTFLQNTVDENDKDCVALSQERAFGDVISLPVERLRNCSHGENCYKMRHPSNEFDPSIDLLTFSAIVCRSNAMNTFYPIGFFDSENGLRDLNSSVSVQLIESAYESIQNLIGWPSCGYSAMEPICPGYRCGRGKCLSPQQLCDGKNDCIEGGDETKLACDLRASCQHHEIKCRGTGICIAKSKICDGVNDCGAGDTTDEPTECTCFNYLALTDPSKICDGIPNCPDKSDESIDCPCKPNSFGCNESDVSPGATCVPPQFVCDRQNDCPNGADERVCISADQPMNSNETEFSGVEGNYYRIKERAFAVDAWQTKCFPKSKLPSSDELRELCIQLGFHNTTKIRFNSLNTATNRPDVTAMYGNAGIKVAPFKLTSTLSLNDKFELRSFRPSRIASPVLIPWSEHDHESCSQLEINCITSL